MPTQGISFLRADSETPVTLGPGRASLLLGQMTQGAERCREGQSSTPGPLLWALSVGHSGTGFKPLMGGRTLRERGQGAAARSSQDASYLGATVNEVLPTEAVLALSRGGQQ